MSSLSGLSVTSAAASAPSAFFSGTKLAALAAAGCGIWAYLAVNRPFPVEFPSGDVWKIRLLCAQSKAFFLLSRIGALLRLGDDIGLLRKFYALGFPHSSSDFDSDIYCEERDMAGVSLYVYRKLSWLPREDEEEMALIRPCLLSFHGGGWIFTSALDRDGHHRHLVKELEVVVVGVEYRRAPEHPFPAAFLDCVAATKYVHENCEEFGIDGSRISVAGDSSGGNLAAAVALKLRDEGHRFLKNQVLIYPSVQFINFRLESFMSRYPMFSREDGILLALAYSGEPDYIAEALLENEHVNEDYFGHPAFSMLQKREIAEPPNNRALVRREALKGFAEKAKNPYLCPLMARTMKGLPPTLIILCEHDILRDDALTYAERLENDGVSVTIVKIPGYHGAFRDFQFTKSGDLMMRSMVKWLRHCA